MKLERILLDTVARTAYELHADGMSLASAVVCACEIYNARGYHLNDIDFCMLFARMI